MAEDLATIWPSWASRSIISTPRSRPRARRILPTCAWASMMWSSASTCCARASTCRGVAGGHPHADKEGFLAPTPPSSRPLAGRRPVRGQSSCTPTGSPTLCSAPSTRPTAGARSSSPQRGPGIEPQSLVKQVHDLTDRVRFRGRAARRVHRTPQVPRPRSASCRSFEPR